jgi:hypothetical protein
MTNRVTNGEQVTVFGYGACDAAWRLTSVAPGCPSSTSTPSPGFRRTWTGPRRAASGLRRWLAFPFVPGDGR